MKKNYVSPLATEVTFETAQILASSPVMYDAEYDTANGGQYDGGRRGTWGDVWK